MTDVDPLDSDDIDAATPAATGGSPTWESPPGLLAGMNSAVEQAIGALNLRALVAEAATTVISQHVSNLARQALNDALTPERIQLLQKRTTAAVEHSFEALGHDHSVRGDELVYGSVDEWLRKYWRFTYRRRVSSKGSGTGRWKADWWNSDEVVQRLETLWRGWEAARLDPGLGTSTWWINHAGPHMTALLAIDGPFADSKDENNVGDPLPYNRPPAHLFAPDKQPSLDTSPRPVVGSHDSCQSAD